MLEKEKLSHIVAVGFLLIAVQFIVVAQFYGIPAKKRVPPQYSQACTQEVKQCLDGSYVSRTGPDCEFAECAKLSIAQNDMSNWHTYRNEEFGFEMEFPAGWSEDEFLLRGSGFTQEFQDNFNEYTLSLSVTGNYNQLTGLPYENLQDYYVDTPYTVKTVKVGGQEAIQPLPRAGSEHVNSVFFFSKDSTFIYGLTFAPNTISEAKIEEGQELFDQILSTFRFFE